MADVHALYNEHETLKANGDLEGAAAKLREALAADDSFALGHAGLAVVLQRLGDHEGAVQHAKRVTELEPNDPFSFTALSVTFQRAYAGTGELGYIRLAEEAMERSRMLSQR